MGVLDQYRAAGETSHHIAALIQRGSRVLITHGNGPQVGFILLRSEKSRDILHQVPMDSCVADTQGAIGYQIEQTLLNELHSLKIERQIATVVTQVVVDRDDPAFARPTKPIGPFFTREQALLHQREDGWVVSEVGERGWRRVVPSPKPLEIVEESVISTLLDRNIIVIAGGGGGIPVTRTAAGELRGCVAVIDKDAVSAMLASHLNATTLIISTNVDKVCLNFNKPEEREIDKMTIAEARIYLSEGHFAPGSMRPKIEAALYFLEHGGGNVIITQPHHLEAALAGAEGTHIVTE
jgi:carbamate kinase